MNTKTLAETCCLPVYIPFVGDFTEESGKKFRESLEAAENAAKESGQEVIPVTIDSYGGSVYALLGMIDAINQCTIPVATIVEGKAMSCGAVLLSCGAEGHRYVGPNATVMVHTVSSFAHGKNDEIQATAGETDRLNEQLFKIMAKNCGHKETYFIDELKDRKMADWYLTGKDCLKHNLANHVKMPAMSVDIEFKTTFG